MNKILKFSIIGAVILTVSSQTSHAVTNFQWVTGSGSLKNASGINIPALNATVLTYVSNDTVVNANSFVSGSQLTLSETFGDDVFYRAMPNVNNGRYTTELMPDSSNDLIGKYAYAIVLDLPFSSFTSIAALPKDGSIRAGISLIGREGTDSMTPIKDATFVPQAFNGGAMLTTLQVIPEPAGVALMLMGTVVFGVIRRRMMNKV